jgi:hypothetical protein
MRWEVAVVEKVVKQPAKPEGDTSANGKPAVVRHASDEEFKKAHQKTNRLHAGLFRRLAE